MYSCFCCFGKVPVGIGCGRQRENHTLWREPRLDTAPGTLLAKASGVCRGDGVRGTRMFVKGLVMSGTCHIFACLLFPWCRLCSIVSLEGAFSHVSTSDQISSLAARTRTQTSFNTRTHTYLDISTCMYIVGLHRCKSKC